ncbi:hypothetical protein [Roseateles aquatilis]|nr:hypothetical protein [Roseateles aquatilis]
MTVPDPMPASRRRILPIVAVLALHVVLLAVLQHAWRRPDARQAQHSSSVRMITIALPPLPRQDLKPAPRREKAEARPAPRRPDEREAAQAPRAPIAVPTETAPPEPRTTVVLTSPAPPASAASGPSARDLMYGAATQRALRQSTQGQPLLSERADQASQAPERAEASARLGQEIMKGATTDCLKGEYAGAGMGLLSAPFLLLAEARGKCRR